MGVHADGTAADSIAGHARTPERDGTPRAIEIAADTADLLAARAAALGIGLSELISALASGATPAAPAKNAIPPSIDGPSCGNARWNEVKAWIDSWGKPDERPRPKFGK